MSGQPNNSNRDANQNPIFGDDPNQSVPLPPEPNQGMQKNPPLQNQQPTQNPGMPQNQQMSQNQGYQPPQNSGVSQGYPNGSQPKKKKTWLWVLLGVLLIFILLIGGCVFFIFNAASAPIGATNDYVAAIKEGNYQEAYDASCTAIQNAYSLQEFEQELSAVTIGNYDFKNFYKQIGIGDFVSGTIEIDSIERQVTYRLIDENDTDKMCNSDLNLNQPFLEFGN